MVNLGWGRISGLYVVSGCPALPGDRQGEGEEV
jgi:hypothetical protein